MMPSFFKRSTMGVPHVAVEEGFFIRDGPRDVLAEALGLEEELAVAHAVRLRVLDVDGREALADGARRLVGGEDALARRRDGVGRGDELVFVGAGEGRHGNVYGFF